MLGGAGGLVYAPACMCGSDVGEAEDASSNWGAIGGPQAGSTGKAEGR